MYITGLDIHRIIPIIPQRITHYFWSWIRITLATDCATESTVKRQSGALNAVKP